MDTYSDFLAGKRKTALPSGFTATDDMPGLFPFQQEITKWAIRLGKAAIFADTGLGKTRMQLAWAFAIQKYTGGKVLILAPLAVASQTVAEGVKIGVPVTLIKNAEGIDGDGIYIVNYDRLHLMPEYGWAGVVLDESSILKSYTGSTRTAIQEFGEHVPYRLACTATPAPNDHMELGTHAEFLGVMTRAEMLATFFCHDGGETQKWRLKGHAVKDFWRWVSSWAVACRKPSDLGHDDSGYILPDLSIVDHPVDDDDFNLGHTLFGAIAQGLNDQRAARRSSINQRVQACADTVNAEPGEQWIVWCGLNDEGDMLTRMIDGAVQVSGADSSDKKEQAMSDFTSGKARVLVSKSAICGYGMNWQHCARMAFVGVDHSYESFYQSIRRCWRFGQKREVVAHVFYATTEGDVVRNLRRKEEEAAMLTNGMVKAMSEFSTMNTDNGRKRDDYNRIMTQGNLWTMHRGDCVEVMRDMEPDSIHYSIFSPPFASLYTYSNSERDMGNCRDDAEFAAQFRYMVAELFRVLKPGRLASFHCMNLPTSKERDGYIGIRDFRGMLIQMFIDEGFIYHSEVVIWKDPVTAMQRTKALGLLHKTIRKDSSMSRQGIPDYLVTMRKPGDNDEPIAHTHEDFPVSVWQRYASPVWMDINPSNTLQHRSAREDEDERHICPLQLQVIERGINLWTNPGDIVFSPFTGIGSEGHVSIIKGRRFIGAELKSSYYDQACKNLEIAEVEATQATLFDFTEDTDESMSMIK